MDSYLVTQRLPCLLSHRSLTDDPEVNRSHLERSIEVLERLGTGDTGSGLAVECPPPPTRIYQDDFAPPHSG